MVETWERRRLFPALWRGLKGQCPSCGRAKLFRAYLKQVDRCPECGEQWSEIRSDDAAPWLTILIVGHVVAPLMVAMAKSGATPGEMAIVVIPVLIVSCLLVLPRAKALFMAAIWALRAQSS